MSSVQAFQETVDIETLRLIYKNFDLLQSQLINDDDSEMSNALPTHRKPEELKTILKKYINQKAKGNLVNYGFSKTLEEGRMFAYKCISLQGIPRRIRHSIAKDIYYDLDMKNAHPTILSHYCHLKKISCPLLDEYVNDRDTFFDKLIKFKKGSNGNFSKEDAKTLILKLINGGGEGNQKIPIFLKSFRKEMKLVRGEIRRINPSLVRRALDTKGDAYHNLDGCITNYLMCNIENDILQCIVSECMRRIPKSVGVLVFDGLMLYKETVNDLPELLNHLNKHILATTSYPITLVEKPMNQGLDLSECVPLEETDDEETYYGNMDFTDEGLGIFIINHFQRERRLFFYKKINQIYLFNEKTTLYEEVNPKQLCVKFSEIVLPLAHKALDYYYNAKEEILKQFTEEANEDGEKSPRKPDTREVDSKIKRIQKVCEYVKGTKGQNCILQQVIARLHDDSEFIEIIFDKHISCFPIGNNLIIDFKGLKIRKRTKEDYFTITTDNVFKDNPDTEWVMKYIGELLNTDDRVFIDSFLTIFAYILTGDNSLKILPTLVGPRGNNGKSVFLKLFNSVLKDFGVISSKRVFIKSKSDSVHTAEIIPLIGKRCSYISELSENDCFNEDLIKRISGDDRYISVRGCGAEKQQQVIIDCKLVIITNEIPAFEDKKAFAGRLLIVPFDNVFEKNKAKEAEILSKKDDFFTILCQYADKYFQVEGRVQFCKQMTDATNLHINESDPLRALIQESFAITGNSKDRVSKPEIWSMYMSYCLDNGLKGIGRTKVYKRLEGDFNLQVYRQREYVGIRKQISDDEDNRQVLPL